MTPLAKLSNNLDITVNEARKIIGKYGYKSADLTDDIVGYIERQEKGIVQEVFTGTTEPVKPITNELIEDGVNNQSEQGVSYLELVDDQSQAMTVFSLAKSFGLDPNNIPADEAEAIKSMAGEAAVVQQANQFLEESEKALVASQFTDFKVKIESTIISSELAAEVAYKAGQTAYNRRLLELKEQERERYQNEQEQLQSGLVNLLDQPKLDLNNYQQKALGGTDRFVGKSQKRLKMMNISR